ncbi:hypothetical protein FJ977_10910 [Mesorhizobium sp. B2-1-3A]|nr:hypothetical protein FJ977_10910 [Mesorhizobium sp. B2-1-3A]
MHRADKGIAAAADHADPQALARRPIRCCVDHVFSSSTDHFVILGRSKERSDAAQTPGSMPRLQSVATVRIFPSAAFFDNRHGHGSEGLRDGASLLLRPGMTTVSPYHFRT